MNNHHFLCYNDALVNDDCQLCWVIKYAIDGITPECSCGVGMDESYMKHMLPCKYGSFMHSQGMR